MMARKLVKVIGSFAEFEEVTGRKLDDYTLRKLWTLRLSATAQNASHRQGFGLLV